MTKKYILIILALSLAAHFAFFGHPAKTVFDEVHFGKFVSAYFTGEYYFDIHPPLGKLIIAGMAKISNFEPGFSFETIGQKYTDSSYKWLRFLPSLAGSLLPIVIFLIALELGVSQRFAFLAGLLIILENSLLVQSRLILLDSFLLLFGFLGILFYLKSKNINYKRSPITNSYYLFLAGAFSSLASLVKWTGFSFLGLILIFYFWHWLKSKNKKKIAMKGAVFLIAIPFLIYFLIFAIHFSLLDKPGPGNAFHPADFQEMSLFEKFIELNSEIYQSNARLTATHPYSSQWYEWPFMTRPVYYWNGQSQENPEADPSDRYGARIYLIGNPLIYWLSTIAVIYFTLYLFRNRKNLNYSLLAAGYWLNLLPFIFIGRVMFLYHYFTSLIFGVLILAYSLDKSDFKENKIAFNAILAGSIILFLFFSPLTYGFSIPEWYYNLLVWLPSWR